MSEDNGVIIPEQAVFGNLYKVRRDGEAVDVIDGDEVAERLWRDAGDREALRMGFLGWLDATYDASDVLDMQARGLDESDMFCDFVASELREDRRAFEGMGYFPIDCAEPPSAEEARVMAWDALVCAFDALVEAAVASRGMGCDPLACDIRDALDEVAALADRAGAEVRGCQRWSGTRTCRSTTIARSRPGGRTRAMRA